jgi:hypothetical protein
VSKLDCGGRCVDPVRAKSDTNPLTPRCQIEITAFSLPDFASRHRQVAALIDWRRLIPPCERQRVAAIAGWVRRRSSYGFSTRRFHSAASAIFDLDTVSRLFLVHWLTPAPLHHPMGSRFVLRDGMLSDLARDRRSNARRSDKSDLRGSLPPSRRSRSSGAPLRCRLCCTASGTRDGSLVLFDGGRSLADKLRQIPGSSA